MNIYCELKRNRIKLKIGSEEIEIRIRPDFYSKINGTETYQMFRDKAANGKIRDLVSRHRKKLGLFETWKYLFLRNTAFAMVDEDVQEWMTIRLVHAYATLSLDARVVYVVKRPDHFIDGKLETIESLREANLDNGEMDGDVPISKLR
jgi:hypothetical protein